jgi:hypothetical protein
VKFLKAQRKKMNLFAGLSKVIFLACVAFSNNYNLRIF